MAGALKKVGQHVQEGLEKIREKEWAEPLGKGLAIGASIVNGMGSFLPGAGILGGAMSLGASLLHPEPTLEELREELLEIKQILKDDSKSKAATRSAQRQKKDIEEMIENPSGEIKSNFAEIKLEMKQISKSIQNSNCEIAEDIAKMKDVISQTFLLVADVKYRVCIICVFYATIDLQTMNNLSGWHREN